MPTLIKDNEIVEDSWKLIDAEFDGESPSGDVIVPLQYWLQNKDALLNRSGVSVWLDSHETPDALVDDLNQLPLIAINFPKFADGRGYSYARLLRERYGYQGEIRAIGDVLQDQLFYLKRCGFNAFAVRSDKSIEAALDSLNDFTICYQAATDIQSPLFRRRA